MGVRVSSPTFVGRRHELDRLARALAAARDGQPAMVLVAGEAGVGKTRFVSEVAALARAAGAMVLEGGCVPVGTEGLPYAPLIEALRTLRHLLSPSDFEGVVGPARAELSVLMPHLARAVDQPALPVLSDSSGQGRLFEHLLLLLERLAQRAPIVLVVEDIHWADRSTLELLGFLERNLRRSPVVLLATYRSDELTRGHPLASFLAEQERAGRSERLQLTRFGRAELVDQLRGITGAQPEPEVIKQILARSDGNAFYAEELLAAGPTRGRLPDTIREVLLARVAALSDATQDLVRLAAAGGTRVSPRVLAKVAGSDARQLERSLSEAVARHVLVLDEGAGEERYSFRHALVREAVYDDMLPGERTRLHAAFARVLASQGSAGSDASWAALLAYHWQAAHDLPRAFDAWIRAGIAAEASYAPAEARHDFERALDLWDQVPDAAVRAPLDRVELLMRTAFHAEGPAPSRAVAHIREAIGLVDPAADPTRAGLLHERLGQYGTTVIDAARNLAAFQEAVRLVPAEPPSAARSWVLAGLGRCYSESDRPAEAVVLLEEALSVAQAAGAKHVESRALVPLGRSLLLLGDVEAGLATVRRAREVAAELGDVYEVAGASTWLVGMLRDAGRLDEAAAAGLEAEAYAASHGLGARWGTVALQHMGWALYVLGQWDEATQALVRAQRYELSGLNELYVETELILLETFQGKFETANRRVPRVRLLAEQLSAGVAWASLAELAVWQDDPLTARAAVASLERHPDMLLDQQLWAFAPGIRAEADLAALARVRQAKADLEDGQIRGAALLARMRAAHEALAATQPILISTLAAELATCEAEFSRLEGSPDPDRWAAAVVACATQGPFGVGYALMREAEATLELHRDRPRAARALNEARAIAIRLGAVPLQRATEKLAARAGIGFEAAAAPDGTLPEVASPKPATRGSRGRYDLTPREHEVLELLAAGESDGEIADRLFISKKTASVHVAAIKGKLGARSRVEIVTDAIGLGLIGSPPASSVDSRVSSGGRLP